MMEVFGGVASGITLWETLREMQKFIAKFKRAPEEWKEYLISLENLAHMQSVIKDVAADMPQSSVTPAQTNGSSTVTHADGQPRKILECSNAALRHVRKDAETLLRDFKHLKKRRPMGLWKRIQMMRHQCQFVLEGSKIRKLMQVVQGAKSTLQLALEIALLSRNESGYKETGKLIQVLTDRIVEQTTTLDQVREATRGQSYIVRFIPRPHTRSKDKPTRHRQLLFSRGKRSSQKPDSCTQSTLELESGCQSLGILRVAAAMPIEGGDGQRNAGLAERGKAQTANISGREAGNTPNPGPQIQLNGEVENESESGEWSTDNLEHGRDQNQNRKDNYIQPTVEDVEDEPSTDEAAAKSHSIDAPWLLEPYDWLESDSGPRRVFYGCSCHYAPDGRCDLAPHDSPAQEESDASGWSLSDLMGAARATGHFIRENGAELGRDMENLAKEGFRVESDAFHTFASRWGPLIFPSVVKVVTGEGI